MNTLLTKRLLLGLLMLCCITLSACDRNADQSQTPAATPAQVAKSAASADPFAGMAKAVTSDARHQSFDLLSELAGRPQVGEPVDIKLVLRAIDDASDVKLTISADPKLATIAGGDAAFASVKAGEVVSHTVTLRPIGTGIIVVDANLAVTADGGPHTSTYAIPIAVTDAVAQSSVSAAAMAPVPGK